MNLQPGVILVSGGLDSTTLCYLFLKNDVEFIPLFIHYGQHCKETELEKIKKVLPEKVLQKLEIINVVISIIFLNQNLLIRPIFGNRI